MNPFTKINFEKLRTLAGTHRTALAIGSIVAFFGAIYLVSRHEDSKVVVYRDIEQPDFSAGKIVAPSSDIYQKRERTLSAKIEEIEKQVKAINALVDGQTRGLEQAKSQAAPIVPEPQPAQLSPSPAVNVEPQLLPVSRSSSTGSSSEPRAYGPPNPGLQQTPPDLRSLDKGPDVISFPIKTKVERTEQTVKLPSGSFVKAKLLTGVEAPEGKALPILLQADYAFAGPNKTRIDLSGCFLIAKSTGNLSIERVEMQTSKISCVSKSGRMFERELNGFIADNKDNSFAVAGSMNSKQDRVAAMAFLSAIVSGISGAIGQAQTTSQTNGLGGTSTSLTGDQGKYIAANGASNAATMVTQWYLKQAQGLLPTINVGSGQDIWVVVQDSVELPNWYFKKQENGSKEFNFLSRLTD